MSFQKSGEAINSGKLWGLEAENANFYYALNDDWRTTCRVHGKTESEAKSAHRRVCKNASAYCDEKKRTLKKPKGFKYLHNHLTWGAKQFLRGQFYKVKNEDQITIEEAHRISGIPTHLIRHYKLSKQNEDAFGCLGKEGLRKTI